MAFVRTGIRRDPSGYIEELDVYCDGDEIICSLCDDCREEFETAVDRHMAGIKALAIANLESIRAGYGPTTAGIFYGKDEKLC